MKKIVTLAILGFIMITMAGCSGKAVENTENNKETIIIENTENNKETIIIENTENNKEPFNKNIKNTENALIREIISCGEIIEFRENIVDIIIGDIVETYEFDKNQIKDFYIGQSVKLIKGKDVDTLQPCIKDDFSNRYTSMGESLEKINGTLTEITDEKIKVKSGDKEIEISLYSPIDYKIGNHVSIYYFSYSADEEPNLFNIYNEDTKLELVVDQIDRSDEGHMLLEMSDSNAENYRVDASSSYLEVNLSKIKIGDTLEIYHDGIIKSDVIQVNANLIRR